MPKTQWGAPNSSSAGASASRVPPRPSGLTRYRFHQPVRSLTRCRTPPGLHSGWTTDSSGPPATVTGSPARAPPASSASRSSVPSQGMFGWSHSSQASRRPSGLTRGLA